MSWLVTGGAGYIGAHVVRAMVEDGQDVVALDDLSTGDAARIDGRARFVEGSVLDRDAVRRSLEGVTGVVHIAAKKQVGESVERPAYYYQQNVGGLANLLLAMEATRVDRLMFSSSAATYGLPDLPLDQNMTEDVPGRPISPYGETKLICEWMCADAQTAWGLRWAGLRYFNVAGAGWPELGDPEALNLIPIVLTAVTNGREPRIFGDDYDTPDGTCIRDYVHVLDLAQAHVDTLDYLGRSDRPHALFNVGTGHGSSVREVISQIASSTGYDISPTVVTRRAGDPARLVADPARIEQTLGWRSTKSLEDIVDSAWAAWSPTHGAPTVAPPPR